METCKCIKARFPDADDAAIWLTEILRGTQNEPLVVEESVSADFNNLFRQLQKKWSFTNPTLLQQLLYRLRNVSLNDKIQLYTESCI